MRPPLPCPADLARRRHDRPAPPPGAPGRVDGTLPGRPHPADRAPRARPRRRRHPRPRAAHRGGDAAGRGAGAGPDLHQLPPGTQPEPLVGPRRRRASAASLARRLRPGRAGGGRHRRDDRAPRWGARIEARGIYRDPVRSSRGHLVKASGLRWITVMLLAPVPWAGRVWALPFLAALAPSERFARERGRRHKRLTDRARQLLLLVARWLPGRRLVAVADSSYAAIELLAAARARLTVVPRLRLDARLFAPPPPRRPGTRGRPRVSGARQPTPAERLADPKTRWRRVTVAGWCGRTERRIELVSGTALRHHPGKRVPVRWLLVRDVAGEFEPQGFVCTDPDADPLDVLRWFVRRWSVEVTLAEVRRHLGVETQRQRSDLAIARTTPALLGLSSPVTLWAGATRGGVRPRSAV